MSQRHSNTSCKLRLFLRCGRSFLGPPTFGGHPHPFVNMDPSSGGHKTKLPTSTASPKQTSILGFLSRNNSGGVNSSSPKCHSGQGNDGGDATHISAPVVPSLPTLQPPLSPAPAPHATNCGALRSSTHTNHFTQGTAPLSPPPIALSSSASLVPVTASYIPTLRTLNQLTLPVQYGDRFYTAVLSNAPGDSGLYSRVILSHPAPNIRTPNPDSIFAGAVVCRTEVSPFQSTRSENELALYLQSLALFSPYRGQGLMTMAIEAILCHAAHNPPAPGKRITDAYVHVWTENTDALEWYMKQGFEKVGTKPLESYYHKLRPSTAWVLRRRIRIADLLSPPYFKSTFISQKDGGGPSAAVISSSSSSISLQSTDSGFAPTLSIESGLSIAPPRGGGPRPTPSPTPNTGAQSFQIARPDIEWNDLPEDMVVRNNSINRGSKGLLVPGNGHSSTSGSTTSSRSSSVTRKKKARVYADVAFN